MPTSQGKRWCFTLNNWTEGEYQLLADLLDSEHVDYGVIGKETGEEGTPHLQGYVEFSSNKRFNAAKQLLGPRVHLEYARGNSSQASAYCKKEGDFIEHGSLSTAQGKRNDWERLKDWCKQQTRYPSDFELVEAFPSLMGRYKRSVREFCDLLINPDPIDLGELRQWQRDLELLLDGPADDRRIHFVVDPAGNSGKSWFKRSYLMKHQKETQLMSVGKRDDMAHAVDESKRVFIIDVPRGSMEYLQYSVLEMLKDKVVFSPKYESRTKIIPHNVHVVVMCNEYPDMNKLTGDRYNVIEIGEPDYENYPVFNATRRAEGTRGSRA